MSEKQILMIIAAILAEIAAKLNWQNNFNMSAVIYSFMSLGLFIAIWFV